MIHLIVSSGSLHAIDLESQRIGMITMTHVLPFPTDSLFLVRGFFRSGSAERQNGCGYRHPDHFPGR
ncbi:MAG: hypothetical protein ACI8T1_001558 [Verrucomicrobiales bacterium]|jgi:hypothetical protein